MHRHCVADQPGNGERTMSFHRWLQHLRPALAPGRRPRRAGKRAQLSLEPLEQRALLSTLSLLPVAPAGSLIYDCFVDGAIAVPAKADSYDLRLDANQTVALVAHPSAPGLRPTVSLFGINHKILASATAPSPGTDAVLQAVPIAKAGTYTLTVSGASSSTGAHTLQAILNGGVELEDHGGPTNDSLATAHPLDGTAVPLGANNNRLAVMGTLAGGPALGDVYVAAQGLRDFLTDGLVFRIDHTTGRIAQE